MGGTLLLQKESVLEISLGQAKLINVSQAHPHQILRKQDFHMSGHVLIKLINT